MSWEYDTTVVDSINEYLIDQGREDEVFEGAQLVDIHVLCLTVPETPTIDENGED